MSKPVVTSPLQEGEYVVCQTYPKPQQVNIERPSSLTGICYRGFDLNQAKEVMALENMGLDYSSVGVCQVIKGQLFELNYNNQPDELLVNPDSDYD